MTSNTTYRTYLLSRWVYSKFLERCDVMPNCAEGGLCTKHPSFEDLPEETIEAYMAISRSLLKVLRRDHTIEDLEKVAVP